MTPALALDRVEKAFSTNRKRLPVLDRLTLDIARGEFVVFLGPSGCGKSTLLRIVSGLDHADGGIVTFGDGLSTRDINFVFQQFALLPWLTVADNVALGLIGRGVSPRMRSRRVRQELERFHLTAFASARPYELSGGMQQRVGIARAFATDPAIICLDEAFSELDTFTADELRRELLAIWTERGTTILMVTHLISEAIELADRIAVLTPRPARVAHVVTVTLPRPRNRRSRAFFALEDELTALIAP